MKKNDLLKINATTYRILSIDADYVLAIDCQKKTMPQFFPTDFFKDAEVIKQIPSSGLSLEELSPSYRRTAQMRYTMIASSLSVIAEPKKRSAMIANAALLFNMSKQSIRSFLCTYLVYQDIAALAPRQTAKKELTQDQKNMRWALNKFFYTQNQNSLPTAYTMMLKAKYCDAEGILLPQYPSFNQFRYFYRKSRKLASFYIRRYGLKAYQCTRRPLVGNGVQAFAPTLGTAMLDSTVCDIYLVNESGQLVGRPILVVVCDANTSLCLGYSLLWEGGTYSLQTLMLNVLEDKVALCERLGISISAEQWPSNKLPGIMVTDCGSEYKGQTFEQITELGVTLINLPPYRPELKGTVEKLFDLVQNYYKTILKGKGIIMPDFQERGAHDYRKDAILTLQEFERIVVRCIIHYNCERVIQHYPYTKEMLYHGVKPFANTIWNWKLSEPGVNLIDVSTKDLMRTLLPRTTGKFTRYGLKVNKLRYYADGYTEQFLRGGNVDVAYNPDNCNKVWLKEKGGKFVEFSLIETRFEDMTLSSAQELMRQQKQLVQNAVLDSYQAKIELMSFIETAAAKENAATDVKIKNIRSARKSARRKQHKDIGGAIDE